jgi:lipoprotein-releasing system ATP-binding protein
MLRAEGLSKIYRTGPESLVLFEDLHFTVQAGEMAAIVGESGSGKSTLLHLLAALDVPTSGDVYFASTCISRLGPRDAAVFRNREIGYVWQFHYLLPEFTALENVAMPLLARGEASGLAFAQAEEWLRQVGLADRGRHRSGELSGGEQQRVSLARALVTRPRLLLADEPTGNLDNRTAGVVFALMEQLHWTHRPTFIIVTHNLEFAQRCDRTFRLHQGRFEECTWGWDHAASSMDAGESNSTERSCATGREMRGKHV